MKKIILLIGLVLLIVPGAQAQRASRPAQFFNNVSTVGPSAPLDLQISYNEAAWELITFGNLSTFEITIDGAIDYPCNTANYYPVSKMTEITAPRFRGVDLTGERCIRANLRSKTGFGGISTIKFLPRGTQ